MPSPDTGVCRALYRSPSQAFTIVYNAGEIRFPIEVSGQGDIARLDPRTRRVPVFLETLFAPTIRKSLLAIAGQGMVSGANFLTSIIIGRLAGKEELGLYAIGFSVVVFASELQMSLISTPYMVYSPRLKGPGHAEYAGSSLIHQLALTAFIVVALIVAAIVIASGKGPAGLGPVMEALAAAIGFIILREFVRRICFAALRMKMAFLFDCAVSVLQLAGLLVLYRLGCLSARNAYLAIGAACGLVALAWIWRHRTAFIPDLSAAQVHFKQNWAFGKWVVASSLLWSVSMNCYPWLLAYYRGKADAGAFAACFGIAAFGNVLLLGAQNFLGPAIAGIYAESGYARMRWFVVRASAAFLIPMLPFCIFLWLFGDKIVVLLYGPSFAGNGLVVSVLALYLLALALAFTFSRALFALERADVDFIVNSAGLMVLLSVGIWLVRLYGPLGAALGLLVANIVASSIRGVAFFHFIRSETRSDMQ